jgi:hypothetical protein
MAGTMGNEFSGLPMGDLIGAPLTAACDAQIRLAKATSDFIETVGFNQERDENGRPKGPATPRQVDFAFWRPAKGPAPANPDEKVVPHVEKVVMSVPFLAIVNVPALSIKSLNVTFDMEVKSSESSKESDKKDIGGEVNATFGWGPVSGSVKVTGSVSTAKENTRSTDKSAKYHVELSARDDGMPEGLSRVLDIMKSAIAPLAVGEAKPADATVSKQLPAKA